MFKVLSLDGGGVRGIIPARILQTIEMKTGMPISKLFNLVVGTSTGGIIAAAINVPGDEKGYPKYLAKDMVDLYYEKAAFIFEDSFVHKTKTMHGVFGPKYDRANLDKLLDEYTGETKLSETITSVCLTSYSIETQKPNIWCSYDAKADPIYDYKLQDIAGATSAAPTYFAPKVIHANEGGKYYEVDGGIYINTPETIGVLEALRQHPELTHEDIFLVSIGTGNKKLDISGEKLLNAGILGWLFDGRIIDAMIDASSEFSEIAGSKFFGHNRLRLQVDLEKGLEEMDNGSKENLDRLLAVTEHYIKQNNGLINQVVEKLMIDAKHDDHHEHARNPNTCPLDQLECYGTAFGG